MRYINCVAKIFYKILEDTAFYSMLFLAENISMQNAALFVCDCNLCYASKMCAGMTAMTTVKHYRG